MLSEISWSEKDKHHIISLTWWNLMNTMNAERKHRKKNNTEDLDERG